MPLRRIVLLRHGETDGESSVRYHGSSDVDLSGHGKSQMQAAAVRLGTQPVDLVVASPLKRSWRSAVIVAGGRSIRLESGFREIDFGRWEGLNREEIQARDPVLYDDWQAGAQGFEYPGGETRESFRDRIGLALDQLIAVGAHSALAVLHKGVIREILRRLTGETPAREEPGLGEAIVLTQRPDGTWFQGQTSSNP